MHALPLLLDVAQKAVVAKLINLLFYSVVRLQLGLRLLCAALLLRCTAVPASCESARWRSSDGIQAASGLSVW